jgi:hypothetical protein
MRARSRMHHRINGQCRWVWVWRHTGLWNPQSCFVIAWQAANSASRHGKRTPQKRRLVWPGHRRSAPCSWGTNVARGSPASLGNPRASDAAGRPRDRAPGSRTGSAPSTPRARPSGMALGIRNARGNSQLNWFGLVFLGATDERARWTWCATVGNAVGARLLCGRASLALGTSPVCGCGCRLTRSARASAPVVRIAARGHQYSKQIAGTLSASKLVGALTMNAKLSKMMR